MTLVYLEHLIAEEVTMTASISVLFEIVIPVVAEARNHGH